ncbi:unnamed protein product [Rodentolepis nana]|uniref:PDZ domain-containing protein n=1 Tax=Rodentolepis nana TaxID=102285 RepID=A0A3P7T565_RODNA|nr:unnamed protein product [Rodentolepis nana]
MTQMPLYSSLETHVIGKELESNTISESIPPPTLKTTVNYGELALKYLGVDLSKVAYDDYGNPIDTDTDSNSTVVSPKTSTPFNPALTSRDITAIQASKAIVPRDPIKISQHIREIIVTKNTKCHLGLQLKRLDGGVFVSNVEDGSPAFQAGLRFGDQILRVDEKFVAGMKGKEVMKFIDKKCGTSVLLTIRDRPLGRVFTLTRNSHGILGIMIYNGAVEDIVKGSSAERNGVRINSHLCEINGFNVLGMKDSTIQEIIRAAGPVVKITVIPGFFYKNLSKMYLVQLNSKPWIVRFQGYSLNLYSVTDTLSSLQMSLYPSIESLTIGKEAVAQKNLENAVIAAVSSAPEASVSYGDLATTFLGIDLSRVAYDDFGNPYYLDSSKSTAENNAITTRPCGSIVPVQAAGAIVPRDSITVSQNVREVRLQKDKRGLLGIQLKNLDSGVFIVFVESDSPAAVAGLRFGDQVLKIDEEYMAGKKGKKAMTFVKKRCGETVTLVIRDRPLERALTLTKDSHGSVGLFIEDGLIKSVVEGSSAYRNGVLTHTYICEVNGINCLGMSDKKIRELLKIAPVEVKITLIPEFYFDELTKRLGRYQWKRMDRTMPLY